MFRGDVPSQLDSTSEHALPKVEGSSGGEIRTVEERVGVNEPGWPSPMVHNSTSPAQNHPTPRGSDKYLTPGGSKIHPIPRATVDRPISQTNAPTKESLSRQPSEQPPRRRTVPLRQATSKTEVMSQWDVIMNSNGRGAMNPSERQQQYRRRGLQSFDASSSSSMFRTYSSSSSSASGNGDQEHDAGEVILVCRRSRSNADPPPLTACHSQRLSPKRP